MKPENQGSSTSRSSPSSAARDRPKISEPAVRAAQEITSQRPPDLPPVDAKTERSVALQSDNPKATVEDRAGRQYTKNVQFLKHRAGKCIAELDRADQRLKQKQLHADYVHERTSEEDLEHTGRATFSIEHWMKLGVALSSLVVIAVVSVATTMVMLEGSEKINSDWQKAAMGMIPFIGALLIALAIVDVPDPNRRARLRAIMNVGSIALLMAWVPLAAFVFGQKALEGTDEVADALINGAPASILPGFINLNFVFLMVAIALDIFAGTSFKLTLDKLFEQTRRVRSQPSELYFDRGEECCALSAERAAVADAKASVEGLLSELDQGRDVYVDEVVALVFGGQDNTPGQPPATPPNTRPIPTHPNNTQNGRLNSHA